MRTHLSNQPLIAAATGILLFFSLWIFFFTADFYHLIELLSLRIREYFGTFYLWLGLASVAFMLGIALSPLGKIRLGPGPPQFNRMAWIAMLYSAGMGAGILLRAVQEPVYMLENPPFSKKIPREILALEYTFYQWGFTPWAFYGIFALLLGYSLFVRRSQVQLGNSLPQFQRLRLLPKGIDLLTILTTVVGLVGAIGLGTTQVEGGLSHLRDQPSGSLGMTIGLVFLICLFAFFSAYSGIEKGIKRISTWNIYLSVFLLFFVFFQSDPLLIIKRFFLSLSEYLMDFIPLSLALPPFDPGPDFLTEWTYYYWAFWLAWAPFTGMFIAKISKGRSLREMVLGILIIPSLGSFFWFSAFGSASFELLAGSTSHSGEFNNVFTSIFRFFEYFPLSWLFNGLTILLLVSFLVTSVDSALYVLSMFSDREGKSPQKGFRLIWALVVLVFSLAIIILGNIRPGEDVLAAMQKMLIISSLPFALFTVVAMVLFLFQLIKTLKEQPGVPKKDKR